MRLKQTDECYGCLRTTVCVCKKYKYKCPCTTCLIKGMCNVACSIKGDLLRELIGEAVKMFEEREK